MSLIDGPAAGHTMTKVEVAIVLAGEVPQGAGTYATMADLQGQIEELAKARGLGVELCQITYGEDGGEPTGGS